MAAEQSSSRAHTKRLEDELAALKADITSYEIEEAKEVGNYLVLRVKYLHPDGRAQPGCTFEGSKVMVFKANVLDALKWRAIDPHFTEEGTITSASAKFHGKAAPSPIARFPASDEGWHDAMAYVQMKVTRDQNAGQR